MVIIENQVLYGIFEISNFYNIKCNRLVNLLVSKGWLYRSDWVSNRDLVNGDRGTGKLLPCTSYEGTYFYCRNFSKKPNSKITVQTYFTPQGVVALKNLLISEGIMSEDMEVCYGWKRKLK